MTAPLTTRLAKLERSHAARTAPPPAAAPARIPTPLQFIEALSIEDKDSGELVPFTLWRAQKRALRLMLKENRLYWLKARQLGATWLSLALLLLGHVLG